MTIVNSVTMMKHLKIGLEEIFSGITSEFVRYSKPDFYEFNRLLFKLN